MDFCVVFANLDSLFAYVVLTKIITDNTEIDLPDQPNGKAYFHLLQVCHAFCIPNNVNNNVNTYNCVLTV